MEREACLRAGGTGGWMSGLKLAAASPDLPSVEVLTYRLSLRCGVLFPKLSKLLNQEDALSAPWLRGDLCSPQAPPRDAVILRKGVIRRFRRHILVCYTQVIMPAGADAFAVVGGGCTGRVDRCKARQDRHARRR